MLAAIHGLVVQIRGWFYLLPEDIGELRHKQLPNSDEKQVTKINRDVADLEEHQVRLLSRGTEKSELLA